MNEYEDKSDFLAMLYFGYNVLSESNGSDKMSLQFVNKLKSQAIPFFIRSFGLDLTKKKKSITIIPNDIYRGNQLLECRIQTSSSPYTTGFKIAWKSNLKKKISPSSDVTSDISGLYFSFVIENPDLFSKWIGFKVKLNTNAFKNIIVENELTHVMHYYFEFKDYEIQLGQKTILEAGFYWNLLAENIQPNLGLIHMTHVTKSGVFVDAGYTGIESVVYFLHVLEVKNLTFIRMNNHNDN